MSAQEQRQQQVRAVVEAYIEARGRGAREDAAQVVAKYPELDPELAAEFARLAAVISAMDAASAAQPSDEIQGGIRCPHCSRSTGVSFDTPWSDVECASCGSTFGVAADTVDRGQTLGELGPFALLCRIGIGSFGTVWKAYDARLDRYVAIKIPRAAELTADDREKFRREARAAAQLHHPNIVAVHEIGETAGLLYIVSEYIEGRTLSAWLNELSRTLPSRLHTAAQLASAVSYAHRMGVIHRDLKPGNILIDDQDQPHVLDFGLAKRIAADATITSEGQLVGTPAYMSPEQARGQAQHADARSDVYSLGAILYLMITGELPFRGSVQMVLHQVLHDLPVRPRKLNDAIPLDVETICLKCLEKEPRLRYATAEDLAIDLQLYLSGRPIHARRVGYMGRGFRWVKRHPALTAMSVVLAVAILAGTSVSTYFAMRAAASDSTAKSLEKATGAIGTTVVAEREASAARATAESARYRKIYRDYLQLISELPRARALQLLEEIPQDLRDESWSIVRQRVAEEAPAAAVLYDAHESVTAAAFARDGMAAAFVTAAELHRVAFDGQATPARSPLPSETTPSQIALAPAGDSLLLYGAGTTAWLVTEQQTQPVALEHQDEVVAAAFVPDGRRIITAAGNHRLSIWEVPNGTPVAAPFPLRHEHVQSLRVSKDGGILVSASDTRLQAWNLESLRLIQVPIRWQSEAPPMFCELLAQGRSAVTIDRQGVYRVTLSGGENGPVHPFATPTEIRRTALSADGERLVVETADNRLIFFSAQHCEPLGELTLPTATTLAIAFAADRKAFHVATGSGQILRLPLD